MRNIAVTILYIMLLATSPNVAIADGLRYVGSDPYAALDGARTAGKLLLVEFYAPWNSRSRWLNERVLGNDSLIRFLDKHFVAVKVDTETPQGATMATDYQVTGYPCVIIFDDRGNVLDKIDTPLDAEDFEHRMLTILMAADGSGGWMLRQCFAAAETGDIKQAETYAAEYLASHDIGQTANSVVWPMFENNGITYYYSTSFDYLINHISDFRNTIGTDEVDMAVTTKLLDAMMPYSIGSIPYSQSIVDDIISIAKNHKISILPILESLAEVGILRTQPEKVSIFLTRVSSLMDHVSESAVLQLALSLDVVADRGDRDERLEAAKILTTILSSTSSPAARTLLEDTRARMK